MSRAIGLAVAMAAVPLVALKGGGAAMNALTGRRIPASLHALNERFFGYDVADVNACWSALDPVSGTRAERAFLRLDLVFPILYGAVLVATLLWASRAAGNWPIPVWVPLVLVAVGTLADWTENLTQLRLLDAFVQQLPLDPGLTRWASLATITKLWTESLAIGVIWLYAVVSAVASFRSTS